MRKEDHRRIGRIVCRRLGEDSIFLNPAAIKAIEEGSLAPDIHRERRVHHRGRQGDIILSITNARRSFLESNLPESARYLGIAFHYISDMTCQHEWESAVCDLPEPPRIAQSKIVTPYDINDFMLSRLSAISPSDALRKAVETCYAVAELSWRPLDSLEVGEVDILESIPKLKKRSSLKAVGFFLLIFGTFLGILGLEWGTPVLFTVPAIGLGMTLLMGKDKDLQLALQWYMLDRPPFDEINRRAIIELNRSRINDRIDEPEGNGS